MSDHGTQRSGWSNPGMQRAEPQGQTQYGAHLQGVGTEDRELEEMERKIQDLKLQQAALKARRHLKPHTDSGTPDDERYKYYQGQRLASNVFSPGYGFRAYQPGSDQLPPPEELVGPNGSAHRVYPATGPVRAPVNSDSGWGQKIPQHAQNTSFRSEFEIAPPSPLLSQVQSVQLESDAHRFPSTRSLLPLSPPRSGQQTPVTGTGTKEVKVGRDIPPHVQHQPQTVGRRQDPPPASDEVVHKTAYVAWPTEGVQVEDAEKVKEATETLWRRFGLEGPNVPDLPKPDALGGPRGYNRGAVSDRSKRIGMDPTKANFGDRPRQSWGERGDRRPLVGDEGWGGDLQRNDGWGASEDRGWRSQDYGGDAAAASKGRDGCHKCGEHGHSARECPNGSAEKCYNCQEAGHISRDCPQPKRSAGACHNCGEEGHQSRSCTQPQRFGSFRGSCHRCGQEGHMASQCPIGSRSDGPAYDRDSAGGTAVRNQDPWTSATRHVPEQSNPRIRADTDGWGEPKETKSLFQDEASPTPHSRSDTRPSPAIHPDRMAQMDLRPSTTPSRHGTLPPRDNDRAINDGRSRDNGWGRKAPMPISPGDRGQGWNGGSVELPAPRRGSTPSVLPEPETDAEGDEYGGW